MISADEWWYQEMQEAIKEEKILKCAEYCIDYNMSLRSIAENTGLGKTTVWKYLTQELKYIDDDLFIQCKNILNKHKNNWMHKRDVKGRFSK